MSVRFVTRESVDELVRYAGGPCLSIITAVRAEAGTGQAKGHLQHCLVEAEHRLRRKASASVARTLLGLLRQTLDEALFVQRQERTLAVFAAPDLLRIAWLPASYAETILVSQHFYLRPLLSLLVDEPQFYLLALSHQTARLFRCSREASAEIPLGEAAYNASAGQRQGVSERQEPRDAGLTRAAGGQEAVSEPHHHEAGHSHETRHYFEEVNQVVLRRLSNAQEPLIITGRGYLLPIYRAANSYPHLAESEIARDPWQVGHAQLRQEAWQQLQPAMHTARDTHSAQYRTLVATDKARTADDLKHILPAAAAGLVRTLFIDQQAHVWGEFDLQHGQVYLHQQRQPDDDELLNLAMAYTLANKGAVYPLPQELEIYAPVAALLSCRIRQRE